MTYTAELHSLLQELEAKNRALHELRLTHLSEDRDTATLRLEVDRLKALQPLLDGGLLPCHAAAPHRCCLHAGSSQCCSESSLDSRLEVLARPWQT